MIKKFKKIILLIIPLLLTGCWDYEDINNKCIVISIGVDLVDDLIEFSGEIAKITGSKNGEEAKTGDTYNLLSYGKTFEEARVHYDAENPYPVFLGATRVVVFGTDYAEKGIEPYLNRIDSLYNYRKTLLAVISREKPKALFELEVEKDISVGFLIEDIMNHLTRRGESLYPIVGEILSDIALGKVGYLLPYVGIEEEGIHYLGFAVMKDSKLIDIIDINETGGLLYIMADKPQLSEVLDSDKNNENKISFRTQIKKRKINTDYKNETVSINIDLDLSAVLRYQYYIESISDEDIKNSEKMISEKIEKEIVSIIKRAQNDFECDIFRFAKYFRAQNPEIFRDIKWEDEFLKAEIKANVKTKIINMSLTDPNAKVKQ